MVRLNAVRLCSALKRKESSGSAQIIQVSASTLGDYNPVSYDIGVSVMHNVLSATLKLKDHPDDEDARGIIFYGASLSTSGRLGLGKKENYAYKIYELDFISEILYGAAYRKSLTSLFPQFLKIMVRYYRDDIYRYFKDVFGFKGSIEESSKRMKEVFESMGVDMCFGGEVTRDTIKSLNIDSSLSINDITEMIRGCMR